MTHGLQDPRRSFAANRAQDEPSSRARRPDSLRAQYSAVTLLANAPQSTSAQPRGHSFGVAVNRGQML